MSKGRELRELMRRVDRDGAEAPQPVPDEDALLDALDGLVRSEMLEELHRLVESPALSRLLSDVEGLSSRLLMRLFGEAALLLAVFFALRVAVRLLTHRLRRRDRPAPPPSGA